MIDQGWYSWRTVIGWLLATLAAVGVGWVGVSSVAAKTESTFDRLRALDREKDRHRRAAAIAEKRVDRTRAVDESAGERGVVRDRAHRRVRARVAKQLAGWERLQRAADRRVPISRPGRASDLKRLFEHAETTALKALREDVAALDRLGNPRARRTEGLPRRAKTVVEFAQHRASEQKVTAEKREVLEQARASGREGLETELDEAEQRLQKSLQRLIDHETGEDFHKRKGTLLPPVGSEPDQGFGEKKQEHSMTYVRHTGLSYRAERGTEVQTVAAGLVVHAQRFEGYGNLVIVDHGDGYHSLYAHLREVAVEEGDEVGRGERVGASGATESLDGPKLYFELRREGQPIDPESWFVRQE